MKVLFAYKKSYHELNIYDADNKILFPRSAISQEITVNVVNPEWQWVCRSNSNAFMRSFHDILERIFFTNIKVIFCKGAN